MDMHRSLVIYLGTLSFLATGCIAAGSADSIGSWYEPPELNWQPCETSEGPYTAEMGCSAIRVPVDWLDPAGTAMIDLDVARLPATDPEKRLGVVIVLSGGPGGSGIDELSEAADGLPDVRERFDMVAHAPRTWHSFRLLPPSCRRMPEPGLDIPADEAEYDRILEPLREAVARCRADDELGLADHLDGRAQAIDVDAIRRALGEDAVSLTAQSYGADVVASYARDFPDRIRAAYIDGAVSLPDGPSLVAAERVGRNFELFADWCEATPECALHGEDVRRLWHDLTERANRSPIPANSARFGAVELTGTQLHFMVPGWADPGEDHANWHALAEGIARARDGDASAFADFFLINAAGRSMPLIMAMHCGDGSDVDYSSFMRRVDEVKRVNPYTYGSFMVSIVCGAWPVPVANPYAPLPGDRLPPFLGAGTSQNDFPPTSRYLEHIPGSVAIEVPGSRHVVYLPSFSGPANPCVLRHLSRYLIDLELPPTGTTCESAPASV